ncbi:MAG: hypothetical protein WB812_14420, partial [Woeseiaceae bacterium]
DDTGHEPRLDTGSTKQMLGTTPETGLIGAGAGDSGEDDSITATRERQRWRSEHRQRIGDGGGQRCPPVECGAAE